MIVTADGEQLLMVWNDGFTQRYARPIDENPNNRTYELVQTFSFASDNADVTSLELLNGGQTVIVGLSNGTASGWFVARDPGAGFRDGKAFVQAHKYKATKSAIIGAASSKRDRSFAVVSDEGQVAIWHMTSSKNVATTNAAHTASPIVSIGMSPRNEGVIALHTDGSLSMVEIEEGYPEATMKSLFGAVHYEGEPKPSYVYQSSASDNTAETKMNLRPLIHGTLKATVYAMLIAIPLGVLAAIYTSEFLHPDVRRYIKPVVELMASLPSVVLGFLAAFVVAPWVESYLPAVLIGAFLVPIGLYFVSLCWQVVPDHLTRAVPSSGKFGFMVLALLVTAGIAALLGPTVERTLFKPTRIDVLTMAGSVEPIDHADWPEWVGARTGVSAQEQRKLQRDGLVFQFGEVSKPIEPEDEWKADYEQIIEEAGYDQPSVRRWLDGSIASAKPGWLLVMLLPSAIIVFLVQSKLISRSWGNWLATLPHRKAALAEMGRFSVLLVMTCVLAFILAVVLTGSGFDPRDSIFGPFTQRNSLVVGLIMGFAVIPIIYTISEDALSSVPNSLRSASLGSGATRWQTTIRVVLPVAGSGIFSACMIGLGRAVGETMIVLMATGNTAVMDWNIFGGFRTLAANIAVELPEAPKGEAHYRVLFLCGLVLFIMTFIINTTAELVRQHVRRKNAGL
ncbi:MAG: ABC transporter permease subunit [Phycisphaeraceae bacterium]|nr:ABC transporter permease subunit [Phycisphaeraceae bacterium]